MSIFPLYKIVFFPRAWGGDFENPVSVCKSSCEMGQREGWCLQWIVVFNQAWGGDLWGCCTGIILHSMSFIFFPFSSCFSSIVTSLLLDAGTGFLLLCHLILPFLNLQHRTLSRSHSFYPSQVVEDNPSICSLSGHFYSTWNSFFHFYFYSCIADFYPLDHFLLFSSET